MNSYQKLLQTIDEIKSEGVTPKVTVLPSQFNTRRSKKSVWGVKSKVWQLTIIMFPILLATVTSTIVGIVNISPSTCEVQYLTDNSEIVTVIQECKADSWSLLCDLMTS